MATSATALLAIIRAARPETRCPEDKLAFAIHSALLANGLKLLAVGPAADSTDVPDMNAPEASVDGWASCSPQEYSFLYALTASQPPALLLLKCLKLDGSLLVNLLATPLGPGPAAAGAAGSQGQAPQAPETMELPVSRYISASAPDLPSSYQHFEELIKKVQDALEAQVSSKGGPKPNNSSAASTRGLQSSTSTSGGRRGPADDPLREGPPRWAGGVPAPGRSPWVSGDDDMMPGGIGGIPDIGGLGPGGMMGGPLRGPGGGGLHVGPGHPFFAERVRHPELLPGGGPGGLHGPGGLPGVRWDPINPEGLQGWNPEDFQRGAPGQGSRPGGPGGIHPDVMPMGPGRGTDWDNMFG